jgi:serine protease Do
MSSRGRSLVKLSAITVVAFGLGIAFASALDLPRPGRAEQATPLRPPLQVQTAAVRGQDGTALPSFVDVAEAVKQSVVFIRAERRERVQAQPRMRGVPPEFQDFFRQFQQQEPRFREGSGSGFIVSADGYILTNNHVVADADRVVVKLLDNREFNARVVGRDPATDVAVIKIDADHLPAAVLGNSDATRVGEWALAIGNPLGFQFTVTAGIISAKGRALQGLVDGDQPQAQYAIQDFIQTDAAINPGNSGGPLVNVRGEVVGINSAIASQTGLYSGYGFAIPINLAHRVMNDLIATGHVERAILGVGIREISPEDADYVGLRQIRGVVVNDFSGKNSPARTAGLQPGDVIVALNDSAIDHVAQLQQMVGFRRPGETVRVTVVRRGGERHTYDVRLIAAPTGNEQVAANDSGGGAAPAETSGKLGIAVDIASPDFIRQARLTDDQVGLVVTDVEDGGPSYGKLLPPNAGGPEVIVAVNDTRVRTREEFQRVLRGVRSGEVVSVRVYNPNPQLRQTRVVRIRARP